jgi:rhodanese-related sulfurtransferase
VIDLDALLTRSVRYDELAALIAELRAGRRVAEAAERLVETWGDRVKDLEGDFPEERDLRVALAELNAK